MTERMLPSIESIGLPLVYKLDADRLAQSTHSEMVNVQVKARALEGMQKEAFVYHGPTHTTWRMVSDEGPYLNGTDLAPFPLAFYAAGMAFSFLSELERHSADNQVALDSVTLELDNHYTRQGSALRGDMVGGALPSEIAAQIESDAAPERVAELVGLAEASSPAQAYMTDVLRNTFSLHANGRPIAVEGVAASAGDRHRDPSPRFDASRPAPSQPSIPTIITKRASAEPIKGVEGGAGSSLQSEQKRMLHVHTAAQILDNGLREAEVQLFKPIGSTFRFISDETGQAAPPSLGYLSAGVGFCYMTQLGRYAKIVKLDLLSYRIIQENVFQPGGGGAARAQAKPVDTHVFMTLNDTDEGARRLLRMGEQTCFLHAAMRSSNRSKLTATLNGQSLALS